MSWIKAGGCGELRVGRVVRSAQIEQGRWFRNARPSASAFFLRALPLSTRLVCNSPLLQIDAFKKDGFLGQRETSTPKAI